MVRAPGVEESSGALAVPGGGDSGGGGARAAGDGAGPAVAAEAGVNDMLRRVVGSVLFWLGLGAVCVLAGMYEGLK
jgi:hypothetical protein